MTQKICRVCQKNFSKYTCPRCNLQYCCLDCYKKHSERCTEEFYREHVSEELTQTKASEHEKQRMLEILQRVHEADTAGLPVSPDVPHTDAEAPAHHDGGLSEQTIARLLRKVEEQEGLQVALEDLTPEERTAFEAELASGALARLVLSWEPWWRSAEAQRLSLSSAGTRLIQEAGAEPSGHEDGLQEPTAIPDPPESALPRLGSLSKAPPSPLLQWQLVEILYAYCTAMHLYQGDWASDALGSALAASAASPALEGSALGAPPEPPASAMLALTECISRACMPALHGLGGRHFAAAVVEDVKVLLSCGRPAVVCAITDLRRLFAAAMEEAKGLKQAGSQSRQRHTQGRDAAELSHSSSPMVEGQDGQRGALMTPTRQQKQLLRGHDEGSTGSVANADSSNGISGRRESNGGVPAASARASGRKRLRQQLHAAERRLVFFQSWANEQTRDQYQHILEAVAEASQAFHQAHDLSDAPRGELADMGSVHVSKPTRVDAQQASGQSMLHKPVLQEVEGTGNDTSVKATCKGLGTGSSAQTSEGAGAQYDTLD